MATTKKLNPDNATANKKVKTNAKRNRQMGAGQASYAGTAVTSVPSSVAKKRLKDAAPLAVPIAGTAAVALGYLINQSNKKR